MSKNWFFFFFGFDLFVFRVFFWFFFPIREALEAGKLLLETEKAETKLISLGVPIVAAMELHQQVLDEDLVGATELLVPINPKTGNFYFDSEDDEQEEEKKDKEIDDEQEDN